MLKGEETRQKIIEAAINAFNTEGISWTSYQMLATKVGITQPAIYHYFANRDELLIACCLGVAESGRQFIDKYVDQRKPARQRLQGHLDGNLRWILVKPKEADLLIAMYSNGAFEIKFKTIHKMIDDAAVKRIEIYLVQIEIEKGRKSREMLTEARLVHSLLVGEMIKALRWPKAFSFEERSASLSLIVDALLA